MNIVLSLPEGCRQERAYIWNVLLTERLGLQYKIISTTEVCTTLALDNGVTIVFPEGFFMGAENAWLKPCSMTSQVVRMPIGTGIDLPLWFPDDVVAVFGGIADSPVVVRTDYGLRVGFDLAGSAFVMLTRYEEAVATVRDKHDRFPASASMAAIHGFLDRPIVDEYVELLAACLSHCAPGFQRPVRKFRVMTSHDVDHALYGLRTSIRSLARALAGDITHRRDPRLALRRSINPIVTALGIHDLDVNNTFDYLMDQSERHGLQSAFYFIADGKSRRDAAYRMDMPWIRSLMKRIAARGHEIGLHPGYETYTSPEETRRQFECLVASAEAAGVQQERWGGRQHFLRWKAGMTWENWDAAGLNYDSSLSFAEAAGFRAGTCVEYTTYSLMRRAPLGLVERPLLVMEGTLISPHYMGLEPAERLEVVERIAKICRRYRGDLTLLWHNSKVVSLDEQREYQQVLEIATAA